MGRNMGGTADHFVPCILLNTRDFSCRALNESKPKVQLEFSANQSGTLNESKPKEQHEFSERDKQRILITNIAILHKLWYTYGQGI